MGIPWSDPVADGPVIELAGQRSLANDVSLTAIVQKLQEKQTTVPLVIMTYINPVYQYGIEKFIADLKNTSVKGLIMPDLPHVKMLKVSFMLWLLMASQVKQVITVRIWINI